MDTTTMTIRIRASDKDAFVAAIAIENGKTGNNLSMAQVLIREINSYSRDVRAESGK